MCSRGEIRYKRKIRRFEPFIDRHFLWTVLKFQFESTRENIASAHPLQIIIIWEQLRADNLQDIINIDKKTILVLLLSSLKLSGEFIQKMFAVINRHSICGKSINQH